MMVMCGQSNQIWHYWAGRYPGSVGHLFGPKNMGKQALRDWMPFACDNDAFISYTNRTPWDEAAWIKMLERVKLTRLPPLWVLVPDTVGNRAETLEKWHQYSPVAKKYGWPIAFAVQDGMTSSDVPKDSDVIFVGGTDSFKWKSLNHWTDNFPRVHVGRVNRVEMLESCERLGCESVDGTGWFREPSRPDKLIALRRFIEGHRNGNLELPLDIDGYG